VGEVFRCRVGVVDLILNLWQLSRKAVKNSEFLRKNSIYPSNLVLLSVFFVTLLIVNFKIMRPI